MRLINVETLELEEFVEAEIPKYAILSHRWEDDEVTFEHWFLPHRDERKGFAKVRAFCELVQTNYPYPSHAWVDTCCIDKGSSAELSEAINSMYNFYKNASAGCYVYLCDIESADEIGSSVWFTRGWTLQELIAPRRVKFFNKHWDFIGTKSELKGQLATITGIHGGVLAGQSPSSCSVAQRMSWASNRTTTRLEDQAYSLMGLFDVNMPMLYGEGTKAFLRLQEEIIKQTDDQTIFVWDYRTDEEADKATQKVLATSPAAFRNCQDIVRTSPLKSINAYSVTNAGLSIKLPLLPWAMRVHCAILDCRHQLKSGTRIAIFVQQLNVPRSRVFTRIRLEGSNWINVDQEGIRDMGAIQEPDYDGHRIFIRQSLLDGWMAQNDSLLYGCEIDLIKFPGVAAATESQHVHYYCWNDWDPEKRVMQIPTGNRGTIGVIDWHMNGSEDDVLTIKLGFNVNFEVVVQFTNISYDADLGLTHRRRKHTVLFDGWLRDVIPVKDQGFGHIVTKGKGVTWTYTLPESVNAQWQDMSVTPFGLWCRLEFTKRGSPPRNAWTFRVAPTKAELYGL